MLIDWDLATAGTPTVEFAWYLAHSARRIDATHAQVEADHRAAQEGRLSDAEIELGMLSGLVQYGWRIAHSARVRSAETLGPRPRWPGSGPAAAAGWVPRRRSARELLALATIEGRVTATSSFVTMTERIPLTVPPRRPHHRVLDADAAPVESEGAGERRLFDGGTRPAILWAGGRLRLPRGRSSCSGFSVPDRTSRCFAPWTYRAAGHGRVPGSCGVSYPVGGGGARCHSRQRAPAPTGLAGTRPPAIVACRGSGARVHLADAARRRSSTSTNSTSTRASTRAQIAGWTWLVIYLLEPPRPAARVRDPAADARHGPAARPAAARGLRGTLVVLAVLFFAFGAALYVAPLDVGDLWPWPLTPLTGRATAAWIVALGLLLAAMVWEDDRLRLRPGGRCCHARPARRGGAAALR